MARTFRGLLLCFLRRAAFAPALFCLALPFAQAEQLALTFDDGFDPRTQPHAAEWNAQLLQALSQAKVQAMLFPAGGRVDSAAGLALVADWSHAGHGIGNHTYRHLNLASPRVGLPDFTADVLAAQALFEKLPTWTPLLRFPYLREGDTADKRDRMRDWMTLHGYQVAAVTIDTSDAYYDERFLAWRARHPHDDLARWRAAYLGHLWSRAGYYAHLSHDLLGRDPPQVLRLHTNAINAAFLGDAIAMFRSHGWELVAPQQAYQDALYRVPAETLPAGGSLVWALAHHDKRPGLRVPEEDAKYEKPKLDKLGL